MSRASSIAQGVAAGFLFGTASILIRFLPRLDALSLGFYRLVIAASLMLLLNILLFRRLWISEYRGHGRRIIVLGFLIGLHFIFFISAVKNTTILNATVLTNTTPAMALLLSWIIWRSAPKPLALLGLILTFLGVLTISIAETSISPGNLLGDLEALMAAFFWALYLIVGKPVRAAGNVLLLMTPIYIIAGIIMGGAGLVVFRQIAIPLPAEVLPLLAVAFFPTVLGHTLHFSSLKHLTPFQASTLSLLEPVVASILAALIFLEIPHVSFYVGAASVLVGVYLVLR